MKVRSFMAAAFSVPLLAGLVACATPDPPPPDPWEAAAGQCWKDLDNVYLPIQLTGPRNTLDNTTHYRSADETECSGLVDVLTTTVQAGSREEADALCLSLGIWLPNTDRLADIWDGATIPSDAWNCGLDQF